MQSLTYYCEVLNMSMILKLLGGVSVLLLVCTLICGAWIRTHPPEDIGFHFTLSVAAVLVSLVTILIFLFQRG